MTAATLPPPCPLPLAPMQAGMLYQHLLAEGAPERSGYDIEQLEVSLESEPCPVMMGKAWTHVLRRHPALASRFRWKGVARPVQEHQANAEVPVERLDWSALGRCEQARRREALLLADRLRGFDLGVAPLMRLTVVILGGGRSMLLWTVHHILLDGRSFAEVLLEAFTAYGALQAGQEPATPAHPPRPYGDYLAWLAERDPEPARAYFRELLRGKRAPTPLPCAEPASRPLPERGHGEDRLTLPAAASAGLEALARAHGTTVGGVVQAAWALVLSRLTGEEDVLFGVTRSLRRSALAGEAERMVGLFINSLPARVRIDEAGTVAALLQGVRAQSVAVREHVHAPLTDIQEQSEIPRGSPLFETLLMFDHHSLQRTLGAVDPAWAQRRCQLHEQPAVPLTVIVVHDVETEITVLHDRRRFRPGVGARIAAYLATALERLGQVERVGEVDVLPAHERRQLLEGWNATQAAFSDGLLLHQPFERQVALRPEAVAVEHEGELVSYAQLEARANRLANALIARGLGPGQYVGLCLSRGADLVVGLLGIAKSGAAYVPIDPEYPRERIGFMLADARAPVVVSEPRYAASFEVPVLDPAGAEVAGASPRRPPPRATPDQPCYAIYTSGSTGTPKGVELAHRAVLNTVEWVNRTFQVQPGDRLLFVTSPCFDLSVYDTFGVLGAGATVVVASAERLAEPRELVNYLVEAGITIWDSAPAALQRLVPSFQAHGGPALRLVMLSGDWIPLSLPDAVRRAFPRAQVMSLGGATEAAIWSNWFPVETLDPRWTSIPYGRPIQNARYYVLDRRRQPVPLGVAGDLYIAGACLARGYLERPELTAERFVPCPFVPGERMYLTGDLARHFEDGNLEFLGRADFQVKIRGYRVELGEVEAALAQVEGVREGVASAFVDATGTRALVAHVVPRPGAELTPEGVRARLAETLPDFMVPARVMVLAALPLSANGKVDRKALPAPASQLQPSRAYLAPRTDAERRMVATWEAVLEQHPIGVTDDFFALGGDSLLAVALAAQLEHDLGVEVPLSRILERPTVEALAASLEAPAARGRHLVTLASGGRRPPLVLLPGVGGFGFFFQRLAARLGEGQPVHALHAVGAEDEHEGLEHSIEELAALYEPQVLAACPRGPLVLGGYSFGVLTAFELARRLVAHGREVPLLISFDGLAPGHPRLVPMPERLLLHLGEVLVRDGAGRRRYLRGRIDRLKGRFLPDLAGDQRLEALPGGAQVLAGRLRRLAAALWRARDHYDPAGPLDADLLLLKATEPLEWPGCRTDARYGWDDFIGGTIEVEPVPGAHLALFEGGNDERMANLLLPRLQRLPVVPGR